MPFVLATPSLLERPASPCKDTSLPFKGKANLGEDGSVDFPEVNRKVFFFVLCSILQVFIGEGGGDLCSTALRRYLKQERG